jgi:hypothetical protein
MDFVLYACENLDADTARQAAEFFGQTFIVPIGWTFPEWFDASMTSAAESVEAVAESVGEFFGISGSE